MSVWPGSPASPARPAFAIVLADRAVLFVDGRYTVQAAAQVDTAIFAIVHLVDNPPEQWLEQNLKSGAKIGYDPWLHTAESAEKLTKACAAAGAELVAVETIRSMRCGATARRRRKAR